MYTPENSAYKLEHAALLLEARVAVTPMSGQIRFGGTMELAKHQHKINMNRVEGIVASIPKYMPDFQVTLPKNLKSGMVTDLALQTDFLSRSFF